MCASPHTRAHSSSTVTVVMTRATYDDRRGSYRISGKRMCIMGLCTLHGDLTLPFCSCSDSSLRLEEIAESLQANALYNTGQFWSPCKHQQLAVDESVAEWIDRQAHKLAASGIQTRIQLPFDTQAPAEVLSVRLESSGLRSLDQFSVVLLPRHDAAAIGCVSVETSRCLSCDSHSGRQQCHHPSIARQFSAAPAVSHAESQYMIDDISIRDHFKEDDRGHMIMRNDLDDDLIGFAEQSAHDRPAADQPFIIKSSRVLRCAECNLEAPPGIHNVALQNFDFFIGLLSSLSAKIA